MKSIAEHGVPSQCVSMLMSCQKCHMACRCAHSARGRMHTLSLNAWILCGQVVCAGSLDTFQIFVWSVKTARLLDVLAAHEGPVVAMAFSPTQPLLASASWDKTVRTWDVFRLGPVPPVLLTCGMAEVGSGTSHMLLACSVAKRWAPGRLMWPRLPMGIRLPTQDCGPLLVPCSSL